jgi:hypothetical protein
MRRDAYLSSTAVTDKHELEGGHVARSGSVGHGCRFVVVAGLLLCTAHRLQRIVLVEAVGMLGQ